MARPITWRNVTNTVTGNPASALGIASSAFGRAGRSARERIVQIREGEDRDQESITNEALSSIFAKDGSIDSDDLQNLPAGVDIATILDRMNTQDVTGADVGASKASTRLSTAQAIEEERANTPQAIARALAREDTADELAQSDIELRQKGVEIRQSQLANQNAEIARVQENRSASIAIDAAFSRFQLEANAPAREAATQAIAALNARDDINDPVLRQRLLDDITEPLQNHIAQNKTELAPGFLAEYLINNTASREAIADSSLGSQVAARSERAEARADVRQESINKNIERQRNVLASMATGTNNSNLWQIAANPDGTITVLDKDSAKDNKLSKEQAHRQIKRQTKGVGFLKPGSSIALGITEDKDLPKKAQEEIDDLLARVGGNRQLFTQLTENVEFDPDIGDDEVHGMPSKDDVDRAVDIYTREAGLMLKVDPQFNGGVDPATNFLQQLLKGIDNSALPFGGPKSDTSAIDAAVASAGEAAVARLGE